MRLRKLIRINSYYYQKLDIYTSTSAQYLHIFYIQFKENGKTENEINKN